MRITIELRDSLGFHPSEGRVLDWNVPSQDQYIDNIDDAFAYLKAYLTYQGYEVREEYLA